MSWPLVTLDSICDKVDYGLTASAIENDAGPRFLRITDLQNDTVDWNAVPSCNCSAKDVEQYRLRRGDIVFARTGATTGKSYLLEKMPLDSVFASYLIRVRPNSKVDPKFLSFFFKSQKYWQQILVMANGAAQPGVNSSKLKELAIPLPPLPEQKRIAAILDKADSLRRKNQQAIQLADKFLRAVFLDMFGDLSSSSGNKVKLGDVVLLDARMVDPREDEYLDMLHFGPDRIKKETGLLLPALTAREENLISKKFLFDNRYVLYSKIRPYLKKCAMAETTALCSADMYPIRPVDELVTKEFLWRLLLSDIFTRYTETLPGRANIPKLNRDELSAFEFSLPDFSEQKKFSILVKKLLTTSKLINKSSCNSGQIFNALSQKSFSGKL